MHGSEQRLGRDQVDDADRGVVAFQQDDGTLPLVPTANERKKAQSVDYGLAAEDSENEQATSSGH